jgi:hypothetical protein
VYRSTEACCHRQYSAIDLVGGNARTINLGGYRALAQRVTIAPDRRIERADRGIMWVILVKLIFYARSSSGGPR